MGDGFIRISKLSSCAWAAIIPNNHFHCFLLFDTGGNSSNAKAQTKLAQTMYIIPCQVFQIISLTGLSQIFSLTVVEQSYAYTGVVV